MFSYAVSITDIIDNLDWMMLVEILLAVIPALICITLHELSHGYVAYRLGDDTAKSMGRLTLNPIKHIDLFGLVMMIVFKFGWAKPVPVNPNYFKKPKQGMALTALAGPVSNFLLAFLLIVVLRFTYHGMLTTFCEFLLDTAMLSVGLGLFNLIPIPPLDGSKILAVFLPDRAYRWLMRYERYGMLIVILLVSVGAVSDVLNRAILGVVTLFCRIVGV